MQKCEQLYEGKAKKVFLTDDPDVLIVSYKDDATAFNGLKKGTIVGKGAINNRMTNLLFQKIEAEGVPTHFIQELNDRETAVRRVEIVPLETWLPAVFLKDWVWKRERYLLSRRLNFLIRMMNWEIR